MKVMGSGILDCRVEFKYWSTQSITLADGTYIYKPSQTEINDALIHHKEGMILETKTEEKLLIKNGKHRWFA